MGKTASIIILGLFVGGLLSGFALMVSPEAPPPGYESTKNLIIR